MPGSNIINEYITADDHPPYNEWLEGLRDPRAKAKIIMQVDRMELGLFGDSEPVGEGVSELRINYGPGYRVYYAKEPSRNNLPILRRNVVRIQGTARGA